MAVFLLGNSVRAFAGGSTASFLKMGIGARPIGMGNAFIAVADDINAVAWNPAGLAVSGGKRELGFMHAAYFAGTNYDFLGFSQPSGVSAWAVAVNYLSQRPIEARAADRSFTGSFRAYDMAFNAAYARGVTSALKLGVNVKYIKSRIENESGQGLAADVGILAKTPINGLNAGLAAQNLGAGMKFMEERSPFPLTLGAGLGYTVFGGMILALDVRQLPYDGKTSVSMGTEYAVFSILALRTGYLAGLAGGGGDAGKIGNVKGMNAGLGFKVRGCSFDYAFTPFGELGNVQRFSFTSRF